MLLLILRYLNNVPIAKQCLLLYLYKDVVALALMSQLPLFFYLMACYLGGNQMIIQPVQAKIAIYWGWMGVYQLMIVLNAISIIKFFMKKDMLLDPSMPWDGGTNDESNSINKIRLAILPFFLLLAVMLALDVHTNLSRNTLISFWNITINIFLVHFTYVCVQLTYYDNIYSFFGSI